MILQTLPVLDIYIYSDMMITTAILNCESKQVRLTKLV